MNVILQAVHRLVGDDAGELALRALQIVWINVLLSGDNAVVIALACRGLDPRRRRWAIVGGASFAVALRIVLTVFVVKLLGLPYVKLVGGLLLLWIAFDLLRSRESEEVAAAGSIAGAIRTIAVADAVMSLDNVVAVAAAAKNSMPLIIFGIACSVPLIVFGSQLLLGVLRRFPILVVAGAALLGYVAGGMIASEPALDRIYDRLSFDPEMPLQAAGVVLMLAVAAVFWILRRRRRTGASGHAQTQADAERGGEADRLGAPAKP